MYVLFKLHFVLQYRDVNINKPKLFVVRLEEMLQHVCRKHLHEMA